MTRITIYQKPTCSTCREVFRVLKDSGVDVKTVDYYTEALSKTKLKALLKKMGLSADDLIRKKERIYTEMGLGEKNLSEDALVDLMVTYPDLMQRPIVECGTKAILARPVEKMSGFLSGKKK